MFHILKILHSLVATHVCHRQITLTSWYNFLPLPCVTCIPLPCYNVTDLSNKSHWEDTAGKAPIGLGLLGYYAHICRVSVIRRLLRIRIQHPTLTAAVPYGKSN